MRIVNAFLIGMIKGPLVIILVITLMLLLIAPIMTTLETKNLLYLLLYLPIFGIMGIVDELR